MTKTKPNKWNGVNRRKTKYDWLVKAMYTSAALTLIIFFIGLYFSHYGRPETSKFHIAMFHLELRDYWIPELKRGFLICLSFCIGLSAFSIISNHFRNKRKTDHMMLSPFFFLITSSFLLSYITLF